ncbi:MAG: hypothetical protein ACRD2J_09240 [Thermoanaerobaculia bacterium]
MRPTSRPAVRRSAILVLAFGLGSPSLEGAEPLLLLRSSDGQQGIVRYDPDSGVTSPVASFLYRAGLLSGPWGSLSLSATSDRIIAQGAAYYEFDAESGRLLRRYEALGPDYPGWGFRGVSINAPLADELGIAPGYYGTPFCPPGPDPRGRLCQFPERPFPGHPEPSDIFAHYVFLRRGLAPGDTTIEMVQSFSPLPINWWDLSRLVALDRSRNRFLFQVQGSALDGGGGRLHYLTEAAILNGAVSDEAVISAKRIDVSGRETFRWVQSMTFDESRDALFTVFEYPHLQYERRLIRSSPFGENEHEVRRFSPSEHLDAVVAVSGVQPPTYTQVLPAIGEAAGVNGTYWRSDVWMFNPADDPVTVEIRRLMNPAATRRFSLGAKASLKISNAMRELGGGPAGDGMPLDALIIESDYRSGAQLAVFSRTWTTGEGDGTYGQSVPAVPSMLGYSNHLASTTISLDMSETQSVILLDKREPGRFRHNLGVVNTGDAPLTLRLRYGQVTSHPVPAEFDRLLTLPPRTIRQFSLEALFDEEIVSFVAPRIWLTGDRPAIVWLSMIDNKTGDASFIPFSPYGIEPDGEATHVFPAIAHTPGGHGTFWRTDAYGVFSNWVAGGSPQQPEATFHPATPACPEISFRLEPTFAAVVNEDYSGWNAHQGWFTAFANLGRQACSAASVHGALEIRTASWMSAFSRTYTTREDGGTYGDILPLYPQHGWPYRHFAGIEVGSHVRVNIGLYNGTDDSSRIELRLYDASGNLVANREIELAPRASLQKPLEDLLGSEISDGLYALSVLPLEEQGVWPYVSTVDNVTGDPTNLW